MPLKQATVFKTAAISGFVLGEIYNVFTVMAPLADGSTIPLGHAFMRFLIMSIFFGPFGALAGFGVGLLIASIFCNSEYPESSADADKSHDPEP